MYLDKKAIEAVQDLSTEEVDIPEWGGKVLMRAMSGSDRDVWEGSLTDARGQVKHEDLRANLVAKCLVDENGERIFTDKEIKKLGNKSAKVLDKLFKVASRLSGIGNDDIDQLAKN